MVKGFEIAVINKSNLENQALKRFKDRGYSKKTLRKGRCKDNPYG